MKRAHRREQTEIEAAKSKKDAGETNRHPIYDKAMLA